MNFRTILFLALALLPFLAIPKCQAQNPALHHVKTIHVAQMGSGQESARFGGLLQDELRKVGFEVADAPASADATLTGEFSSEASGDKSSARATVTLKSRSGRPIWSGDYISPHRGQGKEDFVKTTAETCAERLRKDWRNLKPPTNRQQLTTSATGTFGRFHPRPRSSGFPVHMQPVKLILDAVSRAPGSAVKIDEPSC